MALSGLSAGLQGLTLPLSGQRLGVESISPALLSYSLQRRYNYVDPANAVNWAHPLNRGRVAWWLTPPGVGGGGSQILDLTKKNGRGFFINQTPTNQIWSNNFNGFKSYNFINGSSQYIRSDSGFYPSGNNAITVASTVILRSYPNSSIFAITTSSGGNANFYLFEFIGTLQIFTDTSNSANNNAISMALAPSLNVPSRVSWVINQGGTTGAFYINGKFVSQMNFAGINTSTSITGINIGRKSDNAVEANAVIHDVCVWSRALTASEVALDYQLSSVGYRVPDSPLNWR
jgi:hypothetical protein